MAVGKIAKSIFTDIGNAIRVQNGTTAKLLPRDMAAAVAALDGELAGDAGTYAGAEGTGVISSAVFGSIAAAIRGQNGEETRYTPAEMAPAILALSWDKGYKLRALLLDDGTLELNYLDGRHTTQAGRTWTKVYDIDPAGYASGAAVPWVDDKLAIKKVVIDSSILGQGITDASFWFVGCLNLVEVTGFENLKGLTKAAQMFNSCSSLESIYCASSRFNPTGLSASLMFANCTRLVGYNGFVPSTTTGASACKLGQSGVLTDPKADAREWCRVRLYSGGTVYVSAMDDAGPGGEVLADGRMCAGANYNAVGLLPCYDLRAQVTRVEFAASMAAFTKVNLNYWFYGYSALAGVSGWGNVAVAAMRYTFTACTGLQVLSMEGIDGAGITDLFYTFSGSTALTTIYVDAAFTSPGLVSSGCFYNCKALVGGAGTAYSSSAHTAEYFRVDAAGAPGYLTAR